jgi:ribonuclease P protein component
VLAADQRLRRADDFAAVIRRGRRAARDGLVVHVYARDLVGRPPAGDRPDVVVPARAGFLVPRAVGTAVTRNTVRRRLRHALRDELPRLSPGTDVVVRVLPAAAGQSFGELREHLGAALAAATRMGR